MRKSDFHATVAAGFSFFTKKSNKIFNFVATNAKICSFDALLNGNQCAIIVYKWNYYVERGGGVRNLQCYGTDK